MRQGRLSKKKDGFDNFFLSGFQKIPDIPVQGGRKMLKTNSEIQLVSLREGRVAIPASLLGNPIDST